MTHEEFMKLPLESRKRIEEKIVDLDVAVQRQYGFSMIAEDLQNTNKVRRNDDPSESYDGLTEASQEEKQ